MNVSSTTAAEIGLLVALVVVTSGALWLGRVWGTRQRQRAAGDEPQYEVIQGATLALLGLMLGFSFSGAGNRFIERQDLIVQEANAIGTTYLRADLLAEADAAALRGALRTYASRRLAWTGSASWDRPEEARRELTAGQMEIWRIVTRGIENRPGVAMAILAPVNELIDLMTTRDAARRRHVPIPVMLMLWGCAMVSLGSVGYGIGRAGRRVGTQAVLLCVLICAAIAVTIDLDYPMRGMIQLDLQPLIDAEAAMRP